MVINSALTRWIKQGLAHAQCPLCWVAHKAEHEYLWYFFDEYSTQDEGLDAVRAAHGFCARHAGGLRRIEVENLGSTLGISSSYEDTVAGVLELLERLGPRDRFQASPCPACIARDREVAANARYLLQLLEEDPRTIERYRASPGLCLRHFELVWPPDGAPAVAELLRDVQIRSLRLVHEQLGRHIHNQGAEVHDPPGEERDAWQRAIWLCGGWPDPALDA